MHTHIHRYAHTHTCKHTHSHTHIHIDHLTFRVSSPGTGVSSFCLHPGVIRTELGRHVYAWFPLLGALLSLPSLLLMKTPTQGSQTSLHCALTLGLEDLSGRYFR